MKKVFIAVCLNGFTPPQFIQSWTNLILEKKFEFVCLDPGGNSIVQARNRMTSVFLASSATHLLWIDSDLKFTPEQVERITSHDVPIVGGLYPIKEDGPLKWCANWLPDTKPREDGLIAVRHVGTGFMCIERSAIEMCANHSDKYTDSFTKMETPNVWEFRVRGDEYLTEDWEFCHWCQVNGFPAYADTQVQLVHVGGFTEFPLQSQIQASLTKRK